MSVNNVESFIKKVKQSECDAEDKICRTILSNHGYPNNVMKYVYHDRKVEWVLEGEINNIVLAWMKTDWNADSNCGSFNINYACVYFN